MRPTNPPTVLWNPPAGLANASGAISSGLVGEIGVSPGRSMRPYGACGTNVDSGAEYSGCSGAGATDCSGAGVRTEPSPQIPSYGGRVRRMRELYLHKRERHRRMREASLPRNRRARAPQAASAQVPLDRHPKSGRRRDA